ncbi:unnamed protein product, partial [Iphiclides podalirius]
MSIHTRLFVGNIPLEINDADVHEAFSSYGEIINLELKTKPGVENEYDRKRFAFITLSASNYDVESCIKYFTNADFKGNRLYVTRARESFLERLQRERNQSIKRDEEKKKEDELTAMFPQANPNINLNVKPFPQKRKFNSLNLSCEGIVIDKLKIPNQNKTFEADIQHSNCTSNNTTFDNNDRKKKSDTKRLESMKRKRREFAEKKKIIKTGLIGIDNVSNKKVIFSDNEDENLHSIVTSNSNGDIIESHVNTKNKTLFDDEESESEVNFEIKTQFEGKKGQKVLDLQSRYKSDKRFTLDERFIDEDQSGDENELRKNDEKVDIGQSNETLKQLNILQDVLGVSLKMNNSDSVQKARPKLGMLRYDPMHPDHAKFLAPSTTHHDIPKKEKKKKTNIQEGPVGVEPVVEKVEVSKEQFYKVSETLKEAMIQPTSFSLRNLFSKEENNDKGIDQQNTDYVSLPKGNVKKSNNPLDNAGKNPFVYDSSDSEYEDSKKEINKIEPQESQEIKAVWRENLFFTKNDNRLKEGLLFFTKCDNETERQKERRGLKSVMKKRIYNKDRKTQMFHKKIGGRKKSMKRKIKGRR